MNNGPRLWLLDRNKSFLLKIYSTERNAQKSIATNVDPQKQQADGQVRNGRQKKVPT